MPEYCCFANHFELFDELVHILLAPSHSAADSKHLWVLIMNHASRNFDIGWVFTNIAIICFDSFPFIEHVLQSISKANNVRPVAARKRSHQPNNPAGHDTDTNLISQTMGIELLGIPCLWNSLLIRNGAVGAVD